MIAVIQRVSSASVTVAGEETGSIGEGILVLLGVEKGDGEEDARYLANKIADLRIFPDDGGKMNRSVTEIGGGILSVSQFTLAGSCDKGRRPSFDRAAPPSEGSRLYERFNLFLRERGLTVATGIFQADMKVSLVNDGPVTFVIQSRKGGRT